MVEKIQVIDIMHGEEVFFKEGQEIRTAIYYKVKEDLKSELKVLMDEVASEFREKTPEESAAYVLALFSGENVGASAILARECLSRAEEIVSEIDELVYIAQNLDPNLMYKIDLNTLKRYGFKERG